MEQGSVDIMKTERFWAMPKLRPAGLFICLTLALILWGGCLADTACGFNVLYGGENAAEAASDNEQLGAVPDHETTAVNEQKPLATQGFDINDILDGAELYPQRTGYAALDKMLENIVAPLEGMSTSQKVQALYDWTVRNINYSWDGYKAHTYEGFAVPYPLDDYEDGLQRAIPQEIIDRTYYTMRNHKGVCYDWGAVFAVMMRYIGLDSYVHTGMFRFETDTSSGHHGWAEVQIDGVNYIFDPQREYRMCGDGKGAISHTRYFGLRYEDTDRYTQETAKNASRDQWWRSVTAPRIKAVIVEALASRSGNADYSGHRNVGDNVTLHAYSNADNKPFLGWYDTAGILLTTDEDYSFTVTDNAAFIAMFEGDYFYDIPAGAWYAQPAVAAAEAKIVGGTKPYYFGGEEKLTRAMAAQLIANWAGAELSQYNGGSNFADVPQDKWYAPAVAWAVDRGIAKGIDESHFQPDAFIDREQFAVMAVGYLDSLRLNEYETVDENGETIGVWVSDCYAALEQADAAKISPWANLAMTKAVARGFVNGYEDNTLRPQNILTRAEGVKIIVSAKNWAEQRQQELQNSLAK